MLCRRGGRRQREAADDAEEGDTKERKVQSYEPKPPRDPHSDSKSHSPLFMWIMQQWGWGAMSAPALQECAQAAVLSGCSASDVKDLAATGAHGHSPQNIERDLLRKYCKEMSTPEPFTWKVPMIVREDNARVVKAVDCSFLLPHQWLAALGGGSLQESVLGLSKIHEFWSGQSAQDPKMYQNEVATVTDRDRVMLPFLLHGDGAKFAE